MLRFAGKLLLLTTPFGLFAQESSEVLVNVRLNPTELIDNDSLLSLDLTDFFQVYAGDGPTATFTFSYPEPDEERTVKVGYQIDEWGAVLRDDSGRPLPDVSDDSPTRTIPTFTTGAETPYEHILGGTRADFNWQEASVTFQLLPERTPITVANFMTYVKEGRYEDIVIHRNEFVNEFTGIPVIQTGGWKLAGPDSSSILLDTIETFPPIPLERGDWNDEGTLSMARTSNPDSATSQFYFNLRDNPSLADFYAVFGRLVDKETDLPVLRDFARVPTYDLNRYFQGSAFTNTPLIEPFPLEKDSYSVINSVTISEGDSTGISYAWEFVDFDDEVSAAEQANRDAFAIAINETTGALTADRPDNGTGIVTIRVTASKDGLDDTSFTTRLVGYNNAALETFPTASISTDGWLFVSWYGWLAANDYFPFVYHLFHGPQYILPSSSGTTYNIYDYALGSFYTTRSLYPNIYFYDAKEWFFYYRGIGTNGSGREFYRYSEEKNITQAELEEILGR